MLFLGSVYRCQGILWLLLFAHLWVFWVLAGARQSLGMIPDTWPAQAPWQQTGLHLPFPDTVPILPVLFVLSQSTAKVEVGGGRAEGLQPPRGDVETGCVLGGGLPRGQVIKVPCPGSHGPLSVWGRGWGSTCRRQVALCWAGELVYEPSS